MTRFDELPTLRLVTLRRLVRRTVPPIVFEQSTPIGIVQDVLSQVPAATAIIVDDDRVYQGTLRLAELAERDRTLTARQVLSSATPVLPAEDDLDTATEAMRSHATDRVLVIAPDGDVLGVLTADDLDLRAA